MKKQVCYFSGTWDMLHSQLLNDIIRVAQSQNIRLNVSFEKVKFPELGEMLALVVECENDPLFSNRMFFLGVQIAQIAPYITTPYPKPQKT